MSLNSAELPYRDLPEFLDQLTGDLMSAWHTGSTEDQVAEEMHRMLKAHLESENGIEVLRRTFQPEDAPCEHRVLSCACGAKKYYPSAEYLAEQALHPALPQLYERYDLAMKRVAESGLDKRPYWSGEATGLEIAINLLGGTTDDR